MSYGDRAKQYFLEGYNCTQSVVLAFADIIPIEKEVLLKTVSAFGGGMGRLREVCGAFSGMIFVLGAVCGYNEPKDFDGKKILYGHVQELAARFKEANGGSIVCGELLGIKGADKPVPEKRTADYYKKRPCPEIIKNAADILEKFLEYLPMPLKND